MSTLTPVFNTRSLAGLAHVLLLASGCLVAFAAGCRFSWVYVGFAQTSTCGAWTFGSRIHWALNDTVYVNLGNITDAEERRQILQAIQLWNTANQNNNSRVRFSLDAPPNSSVSTLTIRNGTSADTGGQAARTTKDYITTTDTVISAVINIDINA